MGSTGILLQEQRDGWMLSGASPDAASTLLSSADPDEIAESVLAFANLHSLDKGRLVLAVDSNAVLFANLSTSDDPSASSGQSLRYSLESALPIDAESIVADSFPRNEKSRGLGLPAVAMEVAHVQSLVDALEQLELKIQFIVPASMLIFEQAIDEKLLTVPSISLWLPADDPRVSQAEILVLDSDRTVRTWQTMEAEPSTMDRNLALVRAEFASVPACVFGGAVDLRQRFASSLSNMPWFPCDRETWSKSRAKNLLTNRSEPWVDLRRDALAVHDPWRRYRGAMTRLALAIGLFVLAICGTLVWSASEYRIRASEIDQQQQDLFRRSFPGQRIPAAILGRLRSEHAKAKGLRRSDSTNNIQQSVLDVLPAVMDSLAVDFPFEVKELRVENGSIAMELELASQEDAGTVAAKLSQRGFLVEPPATTLVNGDRVLASYVASAKDLGKSNAEGAK